MRGLRRSSAVVGATWLLSLAVASPVLAATDNGLVVEFTGPTASGTNSSPTVSGQVVAGEARIELGPREVETITLKIVPSAGGAPVASVTQSPGSPVPVSFTWRPSIPINGNFRVEATATGTATLLLVAQPVSGDATRDFSVAAPARAPQRVTASANEDRSVTVSWDRNTEADILGYRIFRRDPGSDTFFQVGPRIGMDHRTCGARCEFADAGTVAVGGDYAYQVLAFRGGPTEPVPSSPSQTATINVPAPTTTVVADPGGSPDAPGTGAPGAPGVAKTPAPAISSFLANRPPPKAPPAPKILEAPDTGFNRELPFGAAPDEIALADEEEPGESEAVLPPDTLALGSDDTLNQGRPLVPVAAGLLLLVLAAHMRLFVSRTRPSVVSRTRPPGVARPVPEPPEPRRFSPSATRTSVARTSVARKAATAVTPPTVTVLPAGSTASSRQSPSRTSFPSDRPVADPSASAARSPAGPFAPVGGGKSDQSWDEWDLDEAAHEVDRAAGYRRRVSRQSVDDDIQVQVLTTEPTRTREPVGVGARRSETWSTDDVWEVVSPGS